MAVSSIAFGLSIGLIDGTSVRVDLCVFDGENAVMLQAVPRLNTVSVLEWKTLVSCDLIPGPHILGSVEIGLKSRFRAATPTSLCLRLINEGKKGSRKEYYSFLDHSKLIFALLL